MADEPPIVRTGVPRSRYEVAVDVATTVLTFIEKKSWDKITRAEYLTAIAEATRALSFRGDRE